MKRSPRVPARSALDVARFYLDENLAEILAILLVALGHDAVSTRALGRKGAMDYDQLSFVAAEARILISNDGDHFTLLHGAWRKWSAMWATSPDAARHPGILVLQQDKANMTAEETARLIHDFVTATGSRENRLFDWTRTYGWREIL
jgi:predicted nuclease of predicted toxin-antitoxin system